MDELKLKQVVAFCILMQNNGGILDKAPIYLEEKFNALMKTDIPEVYLDPINLKIFQTYFEKWKPRKEK